MTECSHHSHLAEVDEAVLGHIGRPLLDERQVRQVHAQVGDTGGVTSVERVSHVLEPPVGGYQSLQSLNHLLCLKYRRVS